MIIRYILFFEILPKIISTKIRVITYIKWSIFTTHLKRVTKRNYSRYFAKLRVNASLFLPVNNAFFFQGGNLSLYQNFFYTRACYVLRSKPVGSVETDFIKKKNHFQIFIRQNHAHSINYNICLLYFRFGSLLNGIDNPFSCVLLNIQEVLFVDIWFKFLPLRIS